MKLNVINKIKTLNIKNKIKKFFLIKRNRIIGYVSLGVIALLVIIFIPKGSKNLFALSEIYDVYPEEVRELYKNTVSISCGGDLHLDIDLGSKVLVSEIDKKTLLDYTFSYLDKNNKLDGKVEKRVIDNAIKELFYSKVDLVTEIDDYVYGEYVYNYVSSKKNISRSKSDDCTVDVDYYSQLYGYSYNEDELSVDINIGYKKDSKLFDLDNNDLGTFVDDVTALGQFERNTYYRYNYVKSNGVYKLKSVEWLERV